MPNIFNQPFGQDRLTLKNRRDIIPTRNIASNKDRVNTRQIARSADINRLNFCMSVRTCGQRGVPVEVMAL